MQNLQITERIKLLCKQNNISISTLLIDCKLSKSFIYDIEKRDVSPSSDKIVKIADYFNVSVDYLLGRNNIQENQTTKIEVNQIELMENYEKLNEKGKEEALKRVHELTYISQYTDTAAQKKIGPAAIAAYGGKGVEMKPLTKEQLEKTQEALKKIKFRTE